jgi:hypothetical protein
MGQSIAVEWDLKEWGEQHGFGEWEHTVEPGGYGRECHVWTARTRFGSLTIRFTDLLMRRDLGIKLIAEMDKHLVGRLAKSGKWHVNALTSGHDVMITFREEVSLDKVENSIERSW